LSDAGFGTYHSEAGRAFSKSYFSLSLTALGDVDAVSIPRNATRYGKRDYFEKALEAGATQK
jgi:hypothetical protein